MSYVLCSWSLKSNSWRLLKVAFAIYGLVPLFVLGLAFLPFIFFHSNDSSLKVEIPTKRILKRKILHLLLPRVSITGNSKYSPITNLLNKA